MNICRSLEIIISFLIFSILDYCSVYLEFIEVIFFIFFAVAFFFCRLFFFLSFLFFFLVSFSIFGTYTLPEKCYPRRAGGTGSWRGSEWVVVLGILPRRSEDSSWLPSGLS